MKNRIFTVLNNGKSISYYFKYIVSEVLGKALPFLLLPLLTRLFTPEEYGQLTEFTVLYNVCFLIGLFGTFSYMRKLYFDKVNIGVRYLSILTLSLSVITLCVLILNLYQFYKPTFLTSIDKTISLLMILSVFSLVIFRIMMTMYNYKFLANKYLFNNLLLTVVNLSFTFLFLFIVDTHINGRVLAILFTPVLLVPIGVYAFHLHHPIRAVVKLSYIKEHTSFSLPLLPHSIMSWARISFDRILISSSLGLVTLGEYSANAQVAMVCFVIFGSLNQALAPKILQKYKENKSSYMKIAKRFIALYSLLYVIMMPILFIITPLLLGEEFIVDYKVIFVLSIAFLFNGWYSIYTHYLIQNSLGSLLSKISTFSAILHVTIIYFYIPQFGVDAVLFASLISYFIAFLLVFHNVRVRVKKQILLDVV